MDATIRINLHCHSNQSDGELSPEQLAERLANDGVRAAALTDHNTIDGLAQFREAVTRRGIGCIPGVELSVAGPGGEELHLLGYGFNPKHPGLLETLAHLRNVAGPAHRPPLVESLRDTLSRKKPRENGEASESFPPGLMPIGDAIAVLHQAGGKAFLAHPFSGDPGYTFEELDANLKDFKAMGLDGLEAVYSTYTPDEETSLIELSEKHDLLVSAGSDFHYSTLPGLSHLGVDMPVVLWKKFRGALFPEAPSDAQAEIAGKSAAGRRKLHAPQWKRFLVRIIFPTILAIVLFVYSIFEIIIPSFEEKLIDRKREMIRELTNLSCSILSEYELEAREGRLSVEQAKRAAAARIQYMRYGKESKDYFWLTDSQPKMIMHPYREDLNGEDLSDFTDQEGKRLFVEIVEVLKENEDGYVEYVWQWKDDPERLEPKQSYVRKFEPWGWIIGTGIYVEDVREEVEAITSNLINISLGISILSVLLLMFVADQSMKIERRRRQTENELHESHEKYRTLVEAATEGTVMILEGRCSYANKTMLEMLNYSEDELSLLDFDDILPDDSSDRRGIKDLIQGLTERRAVPSLIETTLKKKGGAPLPVALAATGISFAGKSGVILAAQDMSGRGLRDTARRDRDAERERLVTELQTSLMFLNEPALLSSSDLLTCEMTRPISRAAAKMSRHGVSAIIVTTDSGEPAGIITDHDLRDRVVARGTAMDRPVMEIMSSPLISISHRALVYEALLQMNEKKVKHLVARDDSGQVVGIIHNNELLRFQRYSLAVMTQEIKRAGSADELKEIRKDLPKLVKVLVESGVRPRNITRAITIVSDAIATRLIGFAIETLGPPPARFAYMVLGSEGREEQTLATDQDSAIVFDDVPADALPAAREYFGKLGEMVCNWLNQVGYDFCEGEVMAKNPKWCQPLGQWKKYYSTWFMKAEPQDILDIKTFFDFRCLYGEKEFFSALHRHIEAELREEPPFLLHYAQYTLQYKLPLGFFGRITVESDGDKEKTFNIKEAMMPIVNFARLYGLQNRVKDTNTLDRLSALLTLGIIRKDFHDEVVQAYDYLMHFRLEHQSRAADSGAAPDNAINPKALTSMEETVLKQAFAQIAIIQKKISFDFLGSA